MVLVADVVTKPDLMGVMIWAKFLGFFLACVAEVTIVMGSGEFVTGFTACRG